MNGEQFQERYDKLMEDKKLDEARLLLMNWTYYITHKEHIEKLTEERKMQNENSQR